ncbi:MAG: hypothetical protein FJZ01_26195 [Candidatus Sericytochromatia bacterium]|nr:hypothetical protein [Candidatus Tanganyikabacteria bacterium]
MTPDRYLAKLRRLGQLSSRERLEGLFDPGTCRPLDPAPWDWDAAVHTAEGAVAGAPAFAYASNFFAREGTISEPEVASITALLARAAAARAPVVALLHSNGARVEDRYAALGANAELFKAVTRLSGVVPQVAACMGLSLGVAAYLAALADFVWMIPGQSFAATTSPNVVRVATGQATSLEGLGGAAMHAGGSGFAHFTAPDERACLAGIRDLLGYVAGSRPAADPPEADPALPASPYVPYDIRRLILTVFDDFLEVHALWAQNLVVGLARLAGRPVGVVANQSAVRGGAIDATAARKASRFIQTADSHGLPLIYLVDVPGIMVSAQEEQAGILDAGGVLFHSVDTAVPRVAVVVRKCFGGAFVMLQARQAGGDRVFAYPGSEIGIAGPEATFAILHGKEYQVHEEAERFKAATLGMIREVPAGARQALEAGIVDAIIDPAETREALIAALAEIGTPARPSLPRIHPDYQF